MKKSIWIFLLAVLVPGFVLGWLALRSAEEQQIIFERRTAELYQKETEALAATVREAVEGERRAFSDTVHRLLANGDATALARNFSSSLAGVWPRKAVGFALDRDGKILSPTVADASRDVNFRTFLVDNGSFVSGSESAMVYAVQVDGKQGGYAVASKSKALANYLQSARADEFRAKAEGTVTDRIADKGIPQKLGVGAVGRSGEKAAAAPQRAAKRAEDSPAPVLRPSVATVTKSGKELDALRFEAAAPAPAAPANRTTSKPAAGAAGRPLEELALPDRRRAGMPEPLERENKAQAAESQRPQATSDPTAQTAVMKDALPALQKQNAGDLKSDDVAKLVQNRQVEPQQMLGAPSNAISMLVPATTEFRTLTEESDEGMVSRFVQDKLDLIFWIRPPEAPEMVFGCLVEAANLADLWEATIEEHPAAARGSYESADAQPRNVMALLDDRGRPAATRPASAPARDWKRPFVASEIGEALPHWEAALYLASPTALADGARGLRRTLTFTIVGAVALIALGGWLVVADARRQLALAQQKTDFVSNVSHELKTPLTSIRMFAELMHDRPPPPEKQSQYLRIITVEAERLTRLINNVLDFAKLGRKQKRFEKKPLDLHDVISRVWESQGLHLREAGFRTDWEAAPGPYPVLGDDDAIAQVLVNLLSNAEKYSQDHKEVELHTWIEDGWLNVTVLDRGMGVPKGEERKIFDAFYRAHDSLSSGIQGSGLGLTLAQRVAREHGGEIQFERRDGGGSRFTLRLPLNKPADSEPST